MARSIPLKEHLAIQEAGTKHYGPFKVIEKIGHAAYCLLLPDNWKLIHPVFNQDLLTPFNEAVYTTQQKPRPPPPEIIGNELEYEVQQILDARRHRNTIEYLVSWKGYGPEHNQWIKRRDVHAKDLITAFYKRYPLKPKQPQDRATHHLGLNLFYDSLDSDASNN